MNSSGQRSTAVMASGIIAILGSLVTAIGVLIGMMGLFVASRQTSSLETVPGMRAMAAAVMAIFFVVTIWGAFSGVGLIRYRNWARVSVLVWAGMMAPFCILAIVFLSFLPLAPTPNPALTQTIVHLFAIFFYGVPLAIAVWWLILFTRPHIVAQFKPVAAAGPGDPFGAVPATVAYNAAGATAAYAVPAPLPGPGIPLPITVLSCFFLLSSVSVLFVFFIHTPAMLFGHAFTGATGSAINAIWCLVYAVSGVGMLKRVSWAYSVAIGLQVVGIVSGIVTLLSPDFENMMRHVMSSMKMAPVEMYQVSSMKHLRGFTITGLLFPLVILGLLAYYRPRFLEACAAKTGSSSTQSSARSDSTSPGNSTPPDTSTPQTPSQSIEPAG